LFTLQAPLASNLEGFAAAFSSWFLYTPARALLDAGEGIASRLGNRVYVPEVVFLTHAHYDHISGLTGFLLSRTAARGDAEKPVTIYYPNIAERGFRTIREHVDTVVRHKTFPLIWQALDAGQRVRVRNWQAEPFRTKHSVPSMGYRFLETRRRLKAEHRGKTPAEIIKLKQSGQDLQEEYEHVILAVTGDAGPGLDPALFAEADVLLHEATFLKPEDREGMDHATAEEALVIARTANVKTLVLYHISQRYWRRDITRTIPELQKKTGYSGRLTVVAGFTHPGGFY
jgi:ribonuclease Z